jgi:hypothetical protein
LEAAVGEANGSYAQLFLAYPNAPAAEDALIGVIDKYRTAGIYRQVRQNFSEPLCVKLYTKMLGDLLKLTRTIPGAVGTIYGMAG